VATRLQCIKEIDDVTRIKDIRESIDSTLDHLQERAEAAQVQVALGKMELEQQFDEQQEALLEAATDLRSKLGDKIDPDGELAGRLSDTCERLRLQAKLGAMEGRDALEPVIADLDRRISAFNEALDEIHLDDPDELKEKVSDAMAGYVKKASALKAALWARVDKDK
jgi:hypothetical protein